MPAIMPQAFLEWRIARARLEIVVSDDNMLKDAMDGFNKTYAKDSWISSYLKEGEHFHFARYRRQRGGNLEGNAYRSA